MHMNFQFLYEVKVILPTLDSRKSVGWGSGKPNSVEHPLTPTDLVTRVSLLPLNKRDPGNEVDAYSSRDGVAVIISTRITFISPGQ